MMSGGQVQQQPGMDEQDRRANMVISLRSLRFNYSVSTFRSKLKTHLFKLAFPPWILSHPIIGLPTRIWFLFFLYF